MNKEEKGIFWRSIMKEHAESGLRAVAFCCEHKLSSHQFRWWKTRFKKKSIDNQEAGFIQFVPYVKSPFLKVEATKFTEVGYVGRDVEAIVRDLTELAVNMAKKEEQENVKVKARELAEERLLDILLPRKREEIRGEEEGEKEKILEVVRTEKAESSSTREKLRRILRKGELDERYVELDVTDSNVPMVEIFSAAGLEEMEFNVKEVFGNIFPPKKKKRRVKIPEAMEVIFQEESQKLIDMDKVIQNAVRMTEQNGIIFLDELDKIAGSESSYGPDVSREGVARICLFCPYRTVEICGRSGSSDN